MVVTDFGGFDGIPGYDPIWKALVAVGFKVKETLFGVPFDWRGPTSAFPDFYTNLTRLVRSHAFVCFEADVAVWVFACSRVSKLAALP